MGYIDVAGVSLTLPDGRPLLDEVTFRVGSGSTSALIGPNGAGKTTLLRIIRGDQAADSGVVTIEGGLGVMDQFVGHGEAGEGRAATHPRGGRSARGGRRGPYRAR